MDTFAHNALLAGLAGVAFYQYRMCALLKESRRDAAYWQWFQTPKAFRQLITETRDPQNRTLYNRVLNGFFLVTLYTLLAAVFAFWP